MRSFLIPYLLATSVGLGHPGSPQATDFCAWSPLLQFNEATSCRPPKASELRTEKSSRHETKPQRNAGASNETGWNGPSHCAGKYCVYSNRQFAGGIAVVTTADNLRRISRLQDLSSSAAPGDAEPPPYYATEVPGKGVGLVANRSIRAGERIMRWQPTFLVHKDFAGDVPEEESRRVLDLALLKLPAGRRRAFSRQLGQFGGHRASDIMVTNAFQVDVGGPGAGEGHHLGNFPDVSRFNHDCRPNVAFRIDERLAHHTHAARDIPAGEELTLAYMNPFETFEARQRHIERSWGFRCTCPHCSMSEEDIGASDARLYEIDEMERELGDFASSKASVEMVRRLVSIYEVERLDAKIHGAYVLAALNSNLFGDARSAEKYAALAVDTGVVEFGPDAADVQAMRELGQNPKRHWSWRKRVGG